MIFTVEAISRDTKKKSDLNTLRAAGYIPAVIYGPEMQNLIISVNKAEFMKLYKKSYHEASFYNVVIDGKSYFSVMKERQIHPVTREFLHMDFMAVPAGKTIEFDIPLKFEGEAIGVKSGGLLDVVHHTVKISCKIEQLPDAIHVDISNLELGHSVHIKDLPKGAWNYKGHADDAVAVIHAKKGEQAPKADA